MSKRQWGALLSTTENNQKEIVNVIFVLSKSHVRKDAMEWISEKTTSCCLHEKEDEKTTSCGFQRKEVEETTSSGLVNQAIETTSCGLESNKGSEVTSCDLKAQKKDKVLPKHCPNTPPTTKMNTWVRKGTFNDFLQKFHCDAQLRKMLENDDEEIDEFDCVGKEISTLISTGCPIKKGDPGVFVIPCFIKDMEFDNALADLGVSINLMPTSVFNRLNLPYLSPTRLTIYLADGTILYLKSIAEDVLVKVGDFVVPVDFVICEMHIGLLILGRPFLDTCRAIIDVGMGEITLRFDGKKAKVEMATCVKNGVCASKG
ncbi:uncharacterized protein LOC116012868 [Ipomoea triloba]|uniref:uncharacterized protein LOC116012868 n=1 Tax=Ipomoea triloba TaxID=35885 RepID=UPI00125CE670|nr:uncharacterized protein LOC116012868 [Ipomoea triloba]